MMALFCSFLLLSVVHSSLSSEILGTVMSYYPKTKHSDGSMEVVIRMKVNSGDCSRSRWQCFSGECGNETSAVARIIYKDEKYCQVEQISTLRVSTNAPFEIRSNLVEDDPRDISRLSDRWRNITAVDLRTRSDTGKSNSSPQTSVLPNIRVPVNCPRSYRLLKFDPDGDDIECRFMTIDQLKCDDCDAAALLPDFFNTDLCAVVYTPNLIRPGDMLKVDQIMEDFPRANVNLTYTNGSQETKTPKHSMGKVPVQFIFTVDSSVPNCEEGLYLPKFLPPTPRHEARVFAAVNQPIAIFIRFAANFSNSSELVHNAPVNMTVVRRELNEYALYWIPTEEHVNHHPVCYAVQVTTPFGSHQSEHRCLVVTVVNVPQFLPSTPANGTRLFVSMNQTLKIDIHVETPSNVFMPVISGPANMKNSTVGDGLFLLSWTPSDADEGQNFSVSFFVTFANFILSPDPKFNFYQSEFRTITVTVRNETFPATQASSAFLQMAIVSEISLSDDDIQSTVLKQLREELVSQGLTPQITLRLVSRRKKLEETPPK